MNASLILPPCPQPAPSPPGNDAMGNSPNSAGATQDFASALSSANSKPARKAPAGKTAKHADSGQPLPAAGHSPPVATHPGATPGTPGSLTGARATAAAPTPGSSGDSSDQRGKAPAAGNPGAAPTAGGPSAAPAAGTQEPGAIAAAAAAVAAIANTGVSVAFTGGTAPLSGVPGADSSSPVVPAAPAASAPAVAVPVKTPPTPPRVAAASVAVVNRAQQELSNGVGAANSVARSSTHSTGTPGTSTVNAASDAAMSAIDPASQAAADAALVATTSDGRSGAPPDASDPDGDLPAPAAGMGPPAAASVMATDNAVFQAALTAPEVSSDALHAPPSLVNVQVAGVGASDGPDKRAQDDSIGSATDPAAGAGLQNLTAGSATTTAAPTLKIPSAVDTPEFAQGLSDRVSYMVDNNLTSAKLQVNPPQLGPIEVRIAIQGDHAQVWMTSHSAVTRDALESSSPTLKEMLGAQGFGQVSVDISHRSFQDRTPPPPSYDWAASGPGGREQLPAVTASAPRISTSAVDAYA